ncbi:MAG: hypothetical protein KKC68_01980 [Candidatus Thermoplasmatota archaeon]|nr:hypothetical protein [Candidatus Thermoplasmatota archaeon]
MKPFWKRNVLVGEKSFHFVLVLFLAFLATYYLLHATYSILASSYSWTQDETAEFNYGQKDNIAVSSDSFTLASSFINSQLSGTAINDVYIYDTTADSSSADQVTLGIDPNWRNGVVKTTGTINTTDSGNIQVSVPGNDYTDGNTLEIKIVTGGATGTAEYQWRVKDGTYSSGIATSTSLTQLGSTKVYVSFTTGADWTANDVFQIAS